MSDSDSAPIVQSLEQGKKLETQRKKQNSDLQHQQAQKKRQQREQLRTKIQEQREIKLYQQNQRNLFDDEPIVDNSSNTQSQFTNIKQDDQLLRNLQERLPEKLIKSLKMPLIQQQIEIPILTKSKKIIKKFDNTTIETLYNPINHQQNQQKSIDFLQQNLFDRHKNQRVPISMIIGRKH